MPVETLLRRIIPAVPPAGHRLDELRILELLDESHARVVAALVAMDYGAGIERAVPRAYRGWMPRQPSDNSRIGKPQQACIILKY